MTTGASWMQWMGAVGHPMAANIAATVAMQTEGDSASVVAQAAVVGMQVARDVAVAAQTVADTVDGIHQSVQMSMAAERHKEMMARIADQQEKEQARLDLWSFATSDRESNFQARALAETRSYEHVVTDEVWRGISIFGKVLSQSKAGEAVRDITTIVKDRDVQAIATVAVGVAAASAAPIAATASTGYKAYGCLQDKGCFETAKTLAYVMGTSHTIEEGVHKAAIMLRHGKKPERVSTPATVAYKALEVAQSAAGQNALERVGRSALMLGAVSQDLLGRQMAYAVAAGAFTTKEAVKDPETAQALKTGIRAADSTYQTYRAFQVFRGLLGSL